MDRPVDLAMLHDPGHGHMLGERILLEQFGYQRAGARTRRPAGACVPDLFILGIDRLIFSVPPIDHFAQSRRDLVRIKRHHMPPRVCVKIWFSS